MKFILKMDLKYLIFLPIIIQFVKFDKYIFFCNATIYYEKFFNKKTILRNIIVETIW